MNIDSTCAEQTLTLELGHAGRFQRLADWWHDLRRRREQRLEVQSIAPLGKHVLRDIGVSEEMVSIAQARNESHYERFARSTAEVGGTAARFGF